MAGSEYEVRKTLADIARRASSILNQYDNILSSEIENRLRNTTPLRLGHSVGVAQALH